MCGRVREQRIRADRRASRRLAKLRFARDLGTRKRFIPLTSYLLPLTLCEAVSFRAYLLPLTCSLLNVNRNWFTRNITLSIVDTNLANMFENAIGFDKFGDGFDSH